MSEASGLGRLPGGWPRAAASEIYGEQHDSGSGLWPRPLVGSKQLELRNGVAPGLPAVFADENRLQQIFHNLVGNAVKFTEAGEVEVLAQVREEGCPLGGGPAEHRSGGGRARRSSSTSRSPKILPRTLSFDYGPPPSRRMALRHLLANAVQYLGDQPSPRIEVGVRNGEPGRDAGAPVFYIRDNGMGIDAKYHEKVFGLFERLDPEGSEGTGIGLALVKRIGAPILRSQTLLSKVFCPQPADRTVFLRPLIGKGRRHPAAPFVIGGVNGHEARSAHEGAARTLSGSVPATRGAADRRTDRSRCD